MYRNYYERIGSDQFNVTALDRNHSVTGQHYMTSNNRYTVGSATSVLLDDWSRVSLEEFDCLWCDPYPCEEGELSDIEELL